MHSIIIIRKKYHHVCNTPLPLEKNITIYVTREKLLSLEKTIAIYVRLTTLLSLEKTMKIYVTPATLLSVKMVSRFM